MWLDHLRAIGRTHSTIVTYQNILEKHITSQIGSRDILSINQQDANVLLAVGKPGARNNIARVMRSLFRYGALEGIGGLDQVPFTVKIPRARNYEPIDSSHLATPEQVKQLAECMPERMRLTVYLASICALRKGEVLGLQRRDFINLNKEGQALLTVQRQWNRKGVAGSEYTKPKAGSSGTVAVPDALAKQGQEHLSLYVPDDPDAPLFTLNHLERSPIAFSTFDAYWRTARECVPGMAGFRFHDFRHTGLTLYAQAGATQAEIMARGRHRSPEVVARYQHVMIERDRENTRKPGEAFKF